MGRGKNETTPIEEAPVRAPSPEEPRTDTDTYSPPDGFRPTTFMVDPSRSLRCFVAK